MSDAMDSDVREVIRRRVELRERDGHERLLLNHVDLRALHLPGWPGDERDRLRATALESGPLPEGWERTTHVKAQERYIRYDHITGNLYRPDGSQIDMSEWPRQVVIRGPWREGRHE